VKNLSKCDEKFWDWFSRAYAKLPEGQDFPLDDEDLYDLWVSMWPVIYHTGMAYGRGNAPVRRPMGDMNMRWLFDKCASKTGLEFGLMVEKWHGITWDK
jgi:hypothetical protein